MAYQMPASPPPGSRLIAAYDSSRRSLRERGIALRAAPDLTGFRRYLAARQRAEEMAEAEKAISSGTKLRGGLLRRARETAIDPQLRPVTWAVALRGNRRDVEDAWDHRGRQAHAYIVNSPSNSPAVCGYRPPLRRAAGTRLAALAPASLESNERCRRCLVVLYEGVLRGEVEAGPWPSADAHEPRITDERAPTQASAPAAAAPAAREAMAQQPADGEVSAYEGLSADEADRGELLRLRALGAGNTPPTELPAGEAEDDGRLADAQATADDLLAEPVSDRDRLAVAEATLAYEPSMASEGAAADTEPTADGELGGGFDYNAGYAPRVERDADLAPVGDMELAAPAEADEGGPLAIPILAGWAPEQGQVELEAAAAELQVDVDELGDTALDLVGEGADALTNVLEMGVEDVLVVAAADRTALIVGGYGRGADWAGNVIDMEHEPLLERVMDSGRAHEQQGANVERIFGPFWARAAVLVPLGGGVCVVFGSNQPLELDEEQLWAAAQLAADRFQRPLPEDALADEREIAIALRRMMDAPDASFDAALEHVLTTAAGVLGCSIAAGVARVGRQLTMRAIDLDGADNLDADQLLGSGPLLDGEQRISIEETLTAPDHQLPAVVARLRLPLSGDNLQGLLVVTHTAYRARGFTTQDHRLAEAIAPAAVLVLERAAFGENVQALEDHIRSAPATDPLTGLPNQAAWEEALAVEADRLARSGGNAAVAAFRIAGLRRIDERQGPLARDAALREAAGLLRRLSRSTDVAARVGEDEFRVLIRDGGRAGARKLAARIRRAAREAQAADSKVPPLTISFANAGSRTQLLAASRLVGQRLDMKGRSERGRTRARVH